VRLQNARVRTLKDSRRRYFFPALIAFLATTVMTLLLPSTAAASAANIYLAQNATGAATGADCADALAYSFFNSASNWGSGSTQIGPGTIVHLCGTITAAAGATGLTFKGSGTSGSPITLRFESGAILQAPYWSGGGSNLGGGIVMSGVSYVTVDGGTNGLLRATLNGTPGGACPGGTCSSPAHDGNGAMFQNCSNCTIQNLEIANIYLRTSVSDESSAGSVGCRAISKEGNCSNCTINNNKIHGASSLIEYDLASGSDSNLVVSNNEMYDTSAGIDLAQGSGNSGTLSGFSFFGNHVHDFATWNDSGSSYNFHHDGVHIYTYTSPLSNVSIYNNLWDGNLGNGTSWIYYEQYASGTGSMNVFNNVVNSYATAVNGAGGARAIEVEGNAMNVKIYNNTIIGVNESGTIMSGIYRNGSTAAIDLRNNTIGGNLEALLEGGMISSSSNNNDYDFSGGSSITVEAGYALNNFSAWQAICGCDSASKTSAASLSSSFSPNSGSPLIGAAQNLTSQGIAALDRDYNGAARPASGAWDIGAVQVSQSGSGGAPPAPAALTATVE
jgi:hypothetical protein